MTVCSNRNYKNLECSNGSRRFCLLYIFGFLIFIARQEAKLDNGGSSFDPTPRRSSMDIDKSLDTLHQDDPRLIKLIKSHYLYPPSSNEYNFSRKNIDLEGQFGQATYIANNFFRVGFWKCTRTNDINSWHYYHPWRLK